MTDRLRLFILAGEPSGDRIAADLVQRLRRSRDISFAGVGGSELRGQGLVSLFPMEDLSVMGWSDVIGRLPLLLFRAWQTARSALASKPDVVVLVDSQVFSALVARLLRRAGFTSPILLYVAPAVWAWKPQRAPKLVPLFDEVLAVLPFEPAVMTRLRGPATSYVGHPALERFKLRAALPERGPLLLLPGSRAGELRRHLPLMGAVAERLAGHSRVSGFLLPTPGGMAERVRQATASWAVPVDVVTDEQGKLAAFAAAVGAVAVTGTVTLELALSGVPMATTYVADGGQAKRYLKYRPRFVALPNIVLDRSLVPEELFVEPDVERLTAAITSILDDPAAGTRQLEGFREMRGLMQKGAPEAPLVDAAARVISLSGR